MKIIPILKKWILSLEWDQYTGSNPHSNGFNSVYSWLFSQIKKFNKTTIIIKIKI